MARFPHRNLTQTIMLRDRMIAFRNRSRCIAAASLSGRVLFGSPSAPSRQGTSGTQFPQPRLRCMHGSSATGNKSQPRDLILQQLTQIYSKAMLELAMDSRINPVFEQIDHRTSRSICDAVGERLQQYMRPETELSPRLQQLINELRRRENERH